MIYLVIIAVALVTVGLVVYLCYLFCKTVFRGAFEIMKVIAVALYKFELSTRKYNLILAKRLKNDHQRWAKRKADIENRNKLAKDNYLKLALQQKAEYESARQQWETFISGEHSKIVQAWATEMLRLRTEYEAKKGEWEAFVESEYCILHKNWLSESQRLKSEAKIRNQMLTDEYQGNIARIEKIKSIALQSFSSGIKSFDSIAIAEHFCFSLLFLHLPYSFPRNSKVYYMSNCKCLTVIYQLPGDEHFISFEDVRLVKKSQTLSAKAITPKVKNQFYRKALKQIALSVIHHLFSCDKHVCLDMIRFQGWIEYLEPSTGKVNKPVIMTLEVSKETFSAIDFQNIDPEECFNKQIKGICVTEAKNVVPVQPIIMFNKDDPRFVVPYDVISTVNEESNLATMDWQDFENLIRDLFEKRFCIDGQEVKITQSSRDKGVDAVLFDPDPIKGGKIIIQSKRYTNVVPVSAVRDLYGTVMSEGANRGILVTTSHFGSDSRSFANGKPLTLMDGSELLGLMLNVGIKAKIDLAEAKRLNQPDQS